MIQPHQYDCTHTWATHYKEDCFYYSILLLDCHIIVKCDLASSEKVQESLFVWFFFVRKRHEWEILGVKMSRKCDHSMICQTAKALLQAQNTQDYKKSFFFYTPIISM